MSDNDKQLTRTLQDVESFGLDDVCHLLDISRQAVQQDKQLTKVDGQRGRYSRDQVIQKHFVKIQEHENAVDRMKMAGRHVGITMPPAVSQLDNNLLDQLVSRLDQLAAQMGNQTDRAIMEYEIDRLKAEIRRANRTISTLRNLIESARPSEDLGLDAIQ